MKQQIAEVDITSTILIHRQKSLENMLHCMVDLLDVWLHIRGKDCNASNEKAPLHGLLGSEPVWRCLVQGAVSVGAWNLVVETMQ